MRHKFHSIIDLSHQNVQDFMKIPGPQGAVTNSDWPPFSDQQATGQVQSESLRIGDPTGGRHQPHRKRMETLMGSGLARTSTNRHTWAPGVAFSLTTIGGVSLPSGNLAPTRGSACSWVSDPSLIKGEVPTAAKSIPRETECYAYHR